MSERIKSTASVDIPQNIYDSTTKTYYTLGQFFGKGGFAKCYEITDRQRGSKVYAGKIVPKKLMDKNNQRDKMAQEIFIHRSLSHVNIVGFHHYFEDDLNIYIVLELCKKRSMMELQKRRKVITEPETRYYMKQILNGVQYLHANHIIHRDLKLGNIFLNDELTIKIGDFGLATRVEFQDERKKTLCGTPNYIAPEILSKHGHSYEVDVWSMGCIMYTLLVGKPPFETGTLKDTYAKIKKCDYRVPSALDESAKVMIMRMLQSDPKKRPNPVQLLTFDFFTSGYCPPSLPVSALTVTPRFDHVDESYSMAAKLRKPLQEKHLGNVMDHDGGLAGVKNVSNEIPLAGAVKKLQYKTDLRTIKSQLQQLLSKARTLTYDFGDEMTDPSTQPLIWVSKWVDYSDKYGFGYQLSDDSVGVMYNDSTKLVMLSNGMNVHYINRVGEEEYMNIKTYPAHLEKKVKLLTYFNRYMKENLMKAGDQVPVRESDSLSRIPYLHYWNRTKTAVFMLLSNGTLQINFMNHSKIIACPLMAAVTFIDQQKNFRTFRYQTLEENGCPQALLGCLRYALDKINEVSAS